MLIGGLPPDATIYRNDPELQGWTRTDHLLAAVIDRLDATARAALVGPHVDPKKLRSLKPLVPLDRPGMRRKPRRVTPVELAARFGGTTTYGG